MPTREELLSLLALGFLLLVTVLWWTLALAPTGAAPAWVQSARAVCFGAHDDGLPSGGGWLLLVGEPLGMIAALALVWGRPLGSALRRLWGRLPGRLGMVATAVLLGIGMGLAVHRVASASAPAGVETSALREVDRPAPALRLIDRSGGTLELAELRGRPVLVTFAFAHCQTVCPLLVHDALRAARAPAGAAVVVVTLDPWRDTPSRLPSIARAWALREREHVVSGEIDRVLAVQRAWGIQATRDPRTGEIAHAPATYVLDAAGRIRFVTTGRTDDLVAALSRL